MLLHQVWITELFLQLPNPGPGVGWNLLRSSHPEAPSGLRGREGCGMKKVHVVQVQMDCTLPANPPTLSLHPSCKPVSVRMRPVTEGQRGPVGISGVVEEAREIDGIFKPRI